MVPDIAWDVGGNLLNAAKRGPWWLLGVRLLLRTVEFGCVEYMYTYVYII